MEILFILLNVVLFSGLNTLPVDKEDTDVAIVDPYLENSIDGDDSFIDISSLGPEAFGIPKNESGEYFVFPLLAKSEKLQTFCSLEHHFH